MSELGHTPTLKKLMGLPVAGHFVDRDGEMEGNGRGSRTTSNERRKVSRNSIFSKGGLLGAIGKTQPVIAYARKHGGRKYDTVYVALGKESGGGLRSLPSAGHGSHSVSGKSIPGCMQDLSLSRSV